MTDPRLTDDPRLSDPVVRPDDRIGGIDPVVHPDENGMWTWVAGVALLLLIGFLIVAGSNRNTTTASNDSSTYTAARTATRPSTTGYGSSSPQPIRPAPSAPAPSKSGTQ